MTGPELPDHEPIVITDKRRLDPESGEIRPADPVLEGEIDDAVAEGMPPADAPHPSAVEAELTSDLQRLSAEYANYRKRVDRDRLLVVELATTSFLESLLPLLDSVELARQHGDLEGAFKGVGEGLEQLADKHGLERFGAQGETFDPAHHHALVQAPPHDTASEAMVADVLQPGWRLKSGRILRPAGVAVSEPSASGPPGPPGPPGTE